MDLMTDVNFCGVASLVRMVSMVNSVEELVDYDSVNNPCSILVLALASKSSSALSLWFVHLFAR